MSIFLEGFLAWKLLIISLLYKTFHQNNSGVGSNKRYHYYTCSLKFSRIKYFAVLLNSAQKHFFVDKIFVVKHESHKLHTYIRIQQVHG